MTPRAEIKRYGFIWAAANTLFHTKKRMWLGICGNSGRIAKVTAIRDLLTPLVVQDTLVSGGKCEEGKRCLDFQCSLNLTTWDSWAASIGKKTIGEKPEYWGKILFPKQDGTAHDFSNLWNGKDRGEKGGLIIGTTRSSRNSG